MALFHAFFYSETLGMQSGAEVILPDRPVQGERLPVLYLLHGHSDDHTIWQRRTSIERYVQPFDLAVVMPNGHRSFYTDMACGGRYFTFMADELPALMGAYFPLSNRRDETYVAGLSMGGYGAFKLALNRPRNYAAAASLSGALDIAARFNDPKDATAKHIFGDAATLRSAPHNLLEVASDMARGRDFPRCCPRLFQACGTEDFLYADNLVFRDHAMSLDLPLAYQEGPGSHDWAYWDQRIQDVLNWLPLRAKETDGPPEPSPPGGP